MFFYLDFNFKDSTITVATLPGEEPLPVFPEANTLYLLEGKQRLLSFEVPGGKLLLLGDPVFRKKEKLFESIIPEPGKVNQEVLFQEIKGHYYWFYIPIPNFQSLIPNPLLCGNSFGAIYPVYYTIEKERAVVCSSSFTLAEKTNAEAKDKRNLLERLLFNYPFFNSTWWSGIKLLEAHRYLRVAPPQPPQGGEKSFAPGLSSEREENGVLSNLPPNDGGATLSPEREASGAFSMLSPNDKGATYSPPWGGWGGATVEGDFEVSNYFASPEDSSKDSLYRLSKLFEKETRLFFPDEPFAISLTGGFDGRTLVAAAKKANRLFSTYSFGRPDSTDVTMPAAQAAALRIPYNPIFLDNQYVETASLGSAWEFMRLTEHNGNFGRPHYHHAAQVLSEKTNYILTGNFGSELFRALHLPGVMMSECLIRVFSAKDDSWKDFLKQTAQRWDAHFFQNETDALIADIEIYLRKMEGWDANHKFYHFVFNEIFRKYFGPELVMQSHYLNNRTPYLNLHFFQELNRTIWSGVHARLFEKVKSKRMKGQMFYATFIRQSDKKMYHLKTNKGYSPADVLEAWRLPILASRVVFHKYINNKDIDDNSVGAFIQRFHRQIAEQAQTNDPSFFQTLFEKSLAEIPREQNIENWVKFYSIAAGWEAAKATVAPAVR